MIRHDDAVESALDAEARIFCCNDALEDDRRLDELPDLVQVFPACTRGAAAESICSRTATRWRMQASRGSMRARHSAPRPIVACRALRDRSRTRPRTAPPRTPAPPHPPAQIAIVLAPLVIRRLLIDGDDHRRIAGALRPLEQFPGWLPCPGADRTATTTVPARPLPPARLTGSSCCSGTSACSQTVAAARYIPASPSGCSATCVAVGAIMMGYFSSRPSSSDERIDPRRIKGFARKKVYRVERLAVTAKVPLTAVAVRRRAVY